MQITIYTWTCTRTNLICISCCSLRSITSHFYICWISTEVIYPPTQIDVRSNLENSFNHLITMNYAINNFLIYFQISIFFVMIDFECFYIWLLFVIDSILKSTFQFLTLTVWNFDNDSGNVRLLERDISNHHYNKVRSNWHRNQLHRAKLSAFSAVVN